MAKLPALTLWGNKDPYGDAYVAFELSEPWSPPLVAQVEELVRRFVAAGEVGGYRKDSVPASASSMSLAAPAVVAGAALSFQLRMQGVDGRAYQFLRHMVSRVEHDQAVVRRMDVKPVGGSSTPITMGVVDKANELDSYPTPPARYPFQVASPYVGGKRRRVVVDFGIDLDATHVDLLKGPVGCWAALLEAGAFTLPFGLPDVVDNVMGQVVLFDALAAEIEVPVYQGSEVGWDILLNLLEVFSEKSMAIMSVELA